MSARYRKKRFNFFDKKDAIFIFVIFILLPLVIFGVAQSIHLADHATVIKKTMPAVNKFLYRDINLALEKTRAAVNEEVINKYIEENNSSETTATLTQLAKKYKLTTMVAVNPEGVAVARTPSARTGDYVFQTTPWGRSAALGQATTTIGVGRNFPLIIISAVPIVNKQKMSAGALFGGYIINNQYASDFKKRYLKPNQEVVFYTKPTGITGVSFSEPDTQRLLQIFASQGSDIVQNKESGLIIGHFKIADRLFHVGNIKLYGLNGEVGGMLILTPVKSELPYLAAGMVGLLALLALAAHLKRRHKNKTYRVIIFITALLLLFISIIVYARFVSKLLYKVARPASLIYNSTIGFSPEADIFELTKPQRISIQITTGGEAINTAGANIKFDPQIIRVEDVIINNAFCAESFLIEKEINNKNGQVSIVCGRPGGFFGQETVLADLLIQPLKTGQVQLQFENETEILAHDGLGTNVLRTANSGSYKITRGQKGRGNEFSLFSYSHPNSERWYNQKNIHIDFVRPAGYKNFSYEFDKNPTTIPDGTKIITSTSINLTAEQDGIYYFHIAGKKNGAGLVSRLKIRVDSTPPEPPTIKSSATEINTDEVVRFEFLHNGDNASGAQRNFYVKYDEGMWLPITSNLHLPFQQPGKYTVYLKAFDNANNYNVTSTVITVKNSRKNNLGA